MSRRVDVGARGSSWVFMVAVLGGRRLGDPERGARNGLSAFRACGVAQPGGKSGEPVRGRAGARDAVRGIAACEAAQL